MRDRITASCFLLLAVAVAPLGLGQTPSPNPIQVSVTDPGIKNATDKSLPLTVVTNVSNQASVEAGLIPANIGRRIFGKEVANNYAVVEVIVSNKDSKASLIVQSVFLDYSRWLLSGIAGASLQPAVTTDEQKSNQAGQVASMESRLVRGELLDAQQWTGRNWTIRGLTALGSVGAGFAFPFSSDVVKGIAEFNGVVVPGASTLWPDGTVSQINRISDFGFRTNMIIPKQSSEILVAFFPIDRFLTPTFHKLFVKNPAGFFVPGELLADSGFLKDKSSQDILKNLLQLAHSCLPKSEVENEPKDNAAPKDAKAVAAAEKDDLMQHMVLAARTNCKETPKDTDPDAQETKSLCKLKEMMVGLSLNSVRVVVGGVMTVDLAAVPATIYDVTFSDGNDNKDIWTVTGKERKGTIHGVYLNGGTPSIVDESGAAIDAVTLKAVAGSSSDTALNFTMTVSKCIPSQRLDFVVTKASDTSGSTDTADTKSGKASAGVQSSPFQFAPPPYNCPAPDAGAAGAAKDPVKPLIPPKEPTKESAHAK